MLYSFKEAITKYGSKYALRKAVANGTLEKVKPGFYADKKGYDSMVLFLREHQGIIFNGPSAAFFLGLTDEVPENDYVATAETATRFQEVGLIQTYENPKIFGLGKILYDNGNVSLPIYGLERTLVDTVRNAKKLPFAYYKEIILAYRLKKDQLDQELLSAIAKAMRFSSSIEEAIQKEVF